jgi:DNA-directed RNA polymerase specialized sigma24 family protein
MSTFDPASSPIALLRRPARGRRLPHREVLATLSLVADLPERKRTFLTLKIAGYSYDEIPAQLGVSSRTVNRQLVRARVAARTARG